MKNINEIDDNINELILQKSFDKLTVEEKQKALEYVDGEEGYNSLRNTLLAITTSFGTEEEAEVDTDLKNDLMDRFEKKFGTTSNRVKVIPLYRKPFFQLAAAASIALLIFFAFPFLDSNDKEAQLAMNDKEKSAEIQTDSVIATEEGFTNGLTLSSPIAKAEVKKEADLKDKASFNGPLKEEEEKDASLVPPTSAMMSDVEKKNTTEELMLDDNLAANKGKRDEPKKLTNTSDTFLYEKVTRDYKERERGKKEKDAEKSSGELASKKKSNRKDDESAKLNKSDNYETSPNAYNSTVDTKPGAPAKISSAEIVSAFVEENKTEMMDLLFTAF